MPVAEPEITHSRKAKSCVSSSRAPRKERLFFYPLSTDHDESRVVVESETSSGLRHLYLDIFTCNPSIAFQFPRVSLSAVDPLIKPFIIFFSTLDNLSVNSEADPSKQPPPSTTNWLSPKRCGTSIRSGHDWPTRWVIYRLISIIYRAGLCLNWFN